MTGTEAATRPRAEIMDRFLSGAGWADATRAPLAGDASARRYERLRHPTHGAAVLMDADPLKGEDVRPFERMAAYLTELGLSAPRIYACEPTHGLMLIEDLGDDLFARLVKADPSQEETLYAAAIDLLVDLHRHAPPPDLPLYGPDEMAPLAALATTWYASAGPETDQGTRAGARLSQACHDVLRAATATLDLSEHEVAALRDYHAENLLWLPERHGLARVGLLDFQDAGAGHRGYDVVSLLEDARRDVAPALREAMIQRYIDQTGVAAAPFRAACAALSAQRNLRILGVFARLSLRDGKPGYVALIPRVWAHLTRNLAHPVCAPLRAVAEAELPFPSDALLADLRERAGTCPTR